MMLIFADFYCYKIIDKNLMQTERDQEIHDCFDLEDGSLLKSNLIAYIMSYLDKDSDV